MIEILLAAQVMSVQVSGPRLAPAQAVQVLQASRSELDRTNVFTPGPEELRVITTMASSWKPGSGYFPPQNFRPLGVHIVPGLVYRLPRPGARSEHRRPITVQGRTR